jgi:hypothetical protein
MNVLFLLLTLFLFVGLIYVTCRLDSIHQELLRQNTPQAEMPPLRRELRAMAELRRLEHLKDAMSKSLWLSSRRWPALLKSLFAYIRSLVGDDDYLVCVEANPGPGGPQEQKKQHVKQPPRQHNKNNSHIGSLKDEMAKQKAEIDVLKDKLKERDSVIGQVTQEIKEKVLKNELRNQKRQQKLDENAITFPEFNIQPVSPDAIKLGGDGEKIPGLIHICHLPAIAVRGPALWKRRIQIAFAIVSGLLCLSILYFFIVLGVHPTAMVLYQEVGLGVFLAVLIVFIGIGVYLTYIDTLVSIRLVGLPRHVHNIATDDRPDFDRGEALGPQDFTDLDLCVEIETLKGEFNYINSYSALALPDFWFTKEVRPQSRKLRRLNVNLSQITDALNRKTLEIPKVSRFAQRVDRASRMVASNPKYQENYRRKLETGDSSQEDLLLLACVMLTRDAMVNPMDF